MENNNGSNSRKKESTWIKIIANTITLGIFLFILFVIFKLAEWIFKLLFSFAAMAISWIFNIIVGIIGILLIYDLIKSLFSPKGLLCMSIIFRICSLMSSLGKNKTSRNTTYINPTSFHNIGRPSKPHDHIYSQRVSDGHGGYTWADINARTGETKDQYGHSGYVRNGEFHDSSW
ncbi:hypothetical protein [Limosilactobacillus sp.]|uniref:hypothetical protein n=1 Tax=Limosilactobacillus sp. TaxID=2773925 RepID=UPI0035A0AA8A